MGEWVPVIALGPESSLQGCPLLTSNAGGGWEADEVKRVSGSLTLFGLLGPHRLGLQASVPGRVSGV